LAFEDVPSGRLIARLISDELTAEKPVTADQVKAIARARAKLRKSSLYAIKLLSSGVPTELELLEARARLQATGTDGAATTPRGFSSKRLPAEVRSPFVSDAVTAFLAAEKEGV